MAPISPSQIAELRSLLPNLHIVTPDSPEYESAITRWNSLGERNAGAVAFPTAAQEVSTLLGFASTHALDIAVKAGGHGRRGCSSTTGGLCVDLSRMNAVSVDTASRRIIVGGGALWSDVYVEAEKYGLAAVGGISPSVGVGGLALHGGYGWLTGAHGLALDNILEMQIALANGSLVRASATENEDLFWAMKGAGSLFGAVTEFVLQGYEQKDPVWSGILLFGRESLATIVQVCNKVLARESQGEAALCVGWGILPGRGKEPEIWVAPWYNGPEDKAKEFFAPLLDLQPALNTTKMVPFSASGLAGASAQGKEWRKHENGSSAMAPLDPVFLDRMFDDFAQFLKTVPDAQRSTVAFEVHNPYPTMRVGQTGTAFPDRGNQVNVLIIPTWTKEENDEACRNWCREFSAKVGEEFERRKREEGVDEVTKTSVGVYSNYDGLGLSPKEIFGVNYERLVELKKKYDPDNLFRNFVDLQATN
ncbi:hypothetical protein VTN96DRAFT_7438 [Rasamsonia emersonii]|uniref:FAD-binding PCMH-type domain-containing protein n=1 Tax=Rasamsonia emersonii (strain ATCC 16479 / CBS 393.64 / IMI 116815) TaxID=1408163 RepID=A0A0F4Z0A0_RASE3|nr:hypothetical protein T310_2227 [Rasamsonia emersonii CBS 393.64]KKA23775.1 hypothetical protein T310_2227 [Rasamsonia emersonii CBS 393.64]